MNFTATREDFSGHCQFFPTTYEAVTTFPSDKYIINQIICCCFNGVLALVTIMLNSIAIATISKCSQLKEKWCYFLIQVQSAVDLITGVVGLPAFTFLLASGLKGEANCSMNFFAVKLTFFTTGCSMLTLSCINIERYLGILHPLIHRTKLTKKKLFSLISVALFFQTLFACLSFLYKFTLSKAGRIIMPLFLLKFIYIYTRIYLVARSKNPILNSPNEIGSERITAKYSKKKAYLREIKLVKSCFVLVLVFLFCYAPMSMLVTAFSNISGITNFSIFHIWSITFATLNSSLNSVVLFWTRPVLRKEARNHIKNTFGCSRGGAF